MSKIALYPFALLYGLIIRSRNLLFDLGLFETKPIPGKSICIGNLAVGGTGKSPHVGYLIDLLHKDLPIQVLSRGYGRKSKGFLWVSSQTTPQLVGDEPQMLYDKFGAKAQFAVCEKRAVGVDKLRKASVNSLILLDDAYQHRWVKAGLNIVLTTYDDPVFQDCLLPAGRLREPIKGLERADAIVVTKCPDFNSFQPSEFEVPFNQWKIPVFYSRYTYKALQALGKPINNITEVLVVSAIAQPEQLKEAFSAEVSLRFKSYTDHHAYSASDLREIHHFFDTFASTNTAIVTTAKDWVKIQTLLNNEELQKYPWYLLELELAWSDQSAFNQFISAYVVSD